jgi:hypothetical protein
MAPARRERPRDGRADAARSARDQHHLAREIHPGSPAARQQVGRDHLRHVDRLLHQAELAVGVGRLLQRGDVHRAQALLRVRSDTLAALRSRMISRFSAGSVPSMARLPASCAASSGCAIIQAALSR